MMTFPKAEEDIKEYLLYEYKDKEDKYAIGSIKKDRFIEVNESDVKCIMNIIHLLNGENTIKDIENKAFDSSEKEIDINKFCHILEKANLLENSDKTVIEKSEYEKFSLKLVETNLIRVYNIFKMLSPFVFPAFILTAIIVGISLIYSDIFSVDTSYALFDFENNHIINFIMIFFIGFISLFFHEIAHGVVATKYGLIPRKIIFSLYLYISPIIYLKIPGLYTIKRYQRIMVWLAGVIANCFLFGLGLILYTIVLRIGANVFFIDILKTLWYMNLIMIISNMSPLLPLDGYFIIATLFKIPNLRKKSFLNIKNFIKTGKLTSKGIYLFYVVLSSLAMLFLVFNEFISIYNLFLAGYSENGIFSALWSIKYYIAIILFLIVIKFISAMKGRKEERKKGRHEHNFKNN